MKTSAPPTKKPRQADDMPLPFPKVTEGLPADRSDRAQVALEALAAIDTMSRRIDDLARELNCLGFFDDDDRPRAA